MYEAPAVKYIEPPIKSIFEAMDKGYLKGIVIGFYKQKDYKHDFYFEF